MIYDLQGILARMVTERSVSGLQTIENRMMTRTLPFDVAKGRLGEIVEGMVPGEELVLTAQGAPLAVVTRPPRDSWPCQPGSARGTDHWMAPDFDAPLADFKEYME